MEDLRTDVVYPWDRCEITFKAQVDEQALVLATRNRQLPSGWAINRWGVDSVTFRVVGPPRHTDAATIRAWLNLMQRDTK
jgi:hypothetical protein